MIGTSIFQVKREKQMLQKELKPHECWKNTNIYFYNKIYSKILFFDERNCKFPF